MSEPAETSKRVRGHNLRSEGAPFDSYRTKMRPFGGTSGRGRALCDCGALSDELPSANARKRWHRQHKASALARMEDQ